ncbi:hypothetical protein BGZ94_002559 [Podila epigama]|nr:hypothetical protein BGZ94_002559 [Podila epigama]
MNHKFGSNYFKFDKEQLQGPQARCHEQGGLNSHEFFVAIDGPSKNEYASYKDSSVFLEMYAGIPDSKRCFFEQIREGQACSEYYDIDWALGQATDRDELQRLEKQVFAVFLRMRNQHAPKYAVDSEHCRVLSASKDMKLSLHIIIPKYVFLNNRHLKTFMLAFRETWRSAHNDMDMALLEYIDDGVYSKNRLMRILGSCKFKDLHRPLLQAAWHLPSIVAKDMEFLITNIGSDHVKVNFSEQEVAMVQAPVPSRSQIRRQEGIQSDAPEHIVDAVRAKFIQTPHASQFELKCGIDSQGIRLDLRRTVSGHCVVCKREHNRENGFLSINQFDAISLHCYRSSSPEKGVEVCSRDFAVAVAIEAAIALQTNRGLSNIDITDDACFLTDYHLAPELKLLKLGRGKLVKSANQPPSLLIRCDTGGGKTTYMENLISKNKTSKFLAITPRRTHADMLDDRLQLHGFKNYRDCPPGTIACNKLIIQSESLNRVDMKFFRDDTILILDELCSTIKQMCSDRTHGNMHNYNLMVFERLVRRAKRVICLDADLSDEEVAIMKNLRSDFLLINNTFQQQKNDKVVLFDDRWRLVAECLEKLKDGKRLYISCTMSAQWAEALHVMLTSAGFKGICVTKNMEEDKKRDISKNINTTMADLDYLIHTPTISVGVNYNVKDHVDYVVGFFSTHSEVDVETSMQMMRRVRHVKEKTYLIHVDAAINNLPATAQEVREWICNQHNLVTGSVRVSPTLRFQLDDNDNLCFPDDLYHSMYCHVIAKKHLSMNGFRPRLIQRLVHAGCIVTGNGEKLPGDHPIIATMKNALEKITAISNQQIAGAAPIRPDEYEELHVMQELDADQRASMQKFALMRTYDIQEHSIVTDEWVAAYDKPCEKECYKNLRALSRSSGPSLQECLSTVQQREELLLGFSLRQSPTTAEAHGMLERSQFTKLKYVVNVLVTCGFEDTFAQNKVLAEDIKSRIDEIWVWAGIESNMSQIFTSIKRRRPRSINWTFKSKLACINTVLKEVLGVKIGTVESNKRRAVYCLKHFSSVGSAKNSPLRCSEQ